MSTLDEDVKIWIEGALAEIKARLEHHDSMFDSIEEVSQEAYSTHAALERLTESFSTSSDGQNQKLSDLVSILKEEAEKVSALDFSVSGLLEKISVIAEMVVSLDETDKKNVSSVQALTENSSKALEYLFEAVSALTATDSSNQEEFLSGIEALRTELAPRIDLHDIDLSKIKDGLVKFSDVVDVVKSRILEVEDSLDSKISKESKILLDKTNKLENRLSEYKSDITLELEKVNLSQKAFEVLVSDKLLTFADVSSIDALRRNIDNDVSYIREFVSDSLKDLNARNLDHEDNIAEIAKAANSNETRIGRLEKNVNALYAVEPPKEWEFKFDPSRKGILLYKRSDWTSWKAENLIPYIAPKIVYEGGGLGKKDVQKLIDAAINSNKLTVLKNGILVEESTDILEFGTGFTVTNPQPGVVRVNATGGGGGSTSLNRLSYPLSGFVYTVLSTIHGMPYIVDAKVYNPDGDFVSTKVQINMDYDVTIRSNVDLTNHQLVIIG